MDCEVVCVQARDVGESVSVLDVSEQDAPYFEMQNGGELGPMDMWKDEVVWSCVSGEATSNERVEVVQCP